MLIVRARYLIAMGLLPVGLSTGCNRKGEADSAPPPLDDASVRTPDVKPTPEKTAQPAERIERVDAGDGAWHVRVHRPPPKEEPKYAMPSCPSGQFCVTTASSGARADAPYEECASTTLPIGQTWGESRFDGELTKRERTVSASKACCYSWYQPCPGGRPLRNDDGEMVLAAVTRRTDWKGPPMAPASATHARLAGYWAEQGAAEHASIASFNRFALQLLALGAPAETIKAVMVAGLDEIRHAEMCYALASRHSDEPVGPARLALPPESVPVDPMIVALETLRDGCVGESVAAEIAREAARRAEDPEVITVLERIAADEERHAELAWRSLAWMLARFDEPVRRAILAFVDELRADVTSPDDGDDLDPYERAHGMIGAAEQLRVRATVLREIVMPCIDALSGRRRPDALSAS